MKFILTLFPAPLEAWVVSYKYVWWSSSSKIGEFPAPREVWGGSYLVGKKEKNEFGFIVSGPSRGLGSFLLTTIKLDITRVPVFPAPLEAWGVSYFDIIVLQ